MAIQIPNDMLAPGDLVDVEFVRKTDKD